MKILGVAIKQGNIFICLPKPNRHHHCIKYAIEVLGLMPPISSEFCDQGFYLENGKFLGRHEALEHAIDEKQLIHNVKINFLTSEDIW
jgi:hypothetical protein